MRNLIRTYQSFRDQVKSWHELIRTVGAVVADSFCRGIAVSRLVPPRSSDMPLSLPSSILFKDRVIRTAGVMHENPCNKGRVDEAPKNFYLKKFGISSGGPTGDESNPVTLFFEI